MNAEAFRNELEVVLKDVPREQRVPIEKLLHEVFKQKRKEVAPPPPEPVNPAEPDKDLLQKLSDAQYTIDTLRKNQDRLQDIIRRQDEEITHLVRHPEVSLPESINLGNISYKLLDNIASEASDPSHNDELLETLRSSWLKVARFYKLRRLEAQVLSFSREAPIYCVNIGFSEAAWWGAITSKTPDDIKKTHIPLENKPEES